MILSGPQYMNLGMFSWVLTAIVPRSQYNLTKKIQSVDKLPWMLRLYTRGDDQKLLNQFQYVAKNISLATLENATKEALRLYPVIDTFAPDPEAKVAIWYGSNEPNMKKAMQKLKRAYPNAQDHPLSGTATATSLAPGCDGKGHHRLYEKLTLGEVSGTAHCNPLTR